MRRLPLLALIVSAAALAVGCSKVALDIQVPKETIVQKVERQFPVEKKNGMMTVTLSNPEVIFKSTENRIGITADVTAGMQSLPPGRGHMDCDGTIDFQDGSFTFNDVKMNTFELNGLPGDDGGQLKKLLAGALLHELKGMTVYRLHPDDPKEAMAAQAIRDIKVTDDGLTVTVGAGN